MEAFLVAVLVCVAAVVLDWLLGEPQRWHPLVGFGRWASATEEKVNGQPQAAAKSLILGVFGTLAVITPVMVLATALQFWLSGWWWLLAQVAGVWLAISLRGLAEHGRAVSTALNSGQGKQARLAVGQIVSRDAGSLTDEGVAAAASESMLENGADAVFSSLFWYLVAGLPGVVLHRLVNTLDAMWGYRNARFLYFGRFAAKVDDLMNWLPARLTALTYALLGNTRLALSCWRAQAKTWDSPNAGPVMAAGAGALGVTLGGPAPYTNGIKQRPVLGSGPGATATTVEEAIALVQRGVMLWLVALLTLALGLNGLWPGGAG
ncbi:adenosylcobinamide-phosphate synthase CbiB [Marinobacter halophilus]|uniref:Cobalamin biosynthesis protein CobD n=1 Tax=Marinobacter halophilus TaxID=1323740 RepID=A0A2T1KJ07_9GAMM|nr:adenosylcobinamide-phosphate synthase CbiB [Marinobacter halophilus]PSF10167.1 cobalamin biosynthesis protein [Marinobacter halophilus]GGC68315.1 cobalamin biosynthesis protein CobD [Marinobacter halophilus]